MTTTTISSYRGFWMHFRKRGYLLVSDKKNVTRNVAIGFLRGFLDNEKFSFQITPEILENSIPRIKEETRSGVIVELKENQNGRYYSVNGSNFGGTYGIEEIVILKGE